MKKFFFVIIHLFISHRLNIYLEAKKRNYDFLLVIKKFVNRNGKKHCMTLKNIKFT